MRILFDHGTPNPLRNFLREHFIRTAYEEGWSALSNGDLLRLAEAGGFDLLLTTDKNLRYQQNLASRRIGILVLPTTSWPVIKTHTDKVAAAVNATKPGDYRELDWD